MFYGGRLSIQVQQAVLNRLLPRPPAEHLKAAIKDA
jgi:hypothetical protein